MLSNARFIQNRFIYIFAIFFFSVLFPFSVSAETEYRGINLTLHSANLQDMEVIKESGVNLIRLVLHADNHPKTQWRSYTSDNGSAKVKLQNRLYDFFRTAASYDIKIILDVHSWPCRDSGEFWYSESCQRQYLNFLDDLVLRFDSFESLLGYDVMNEPDYLKSLLDDSERKRVRKLKAFSIPDEWNETTKDYFYLMEKVIDRIRLNSNKRIYIESPFFYSNAAFWDMMKPVSNAENICYSFHMYEPFKFTHQHKLRRGEAKIVYPSSKHNYEVLERFVKPVIDFQKRSKNQCMLVGEFGVLAQTENSGADVWLRDVIKLFEKNGWDWAYWSQSIKQRSPYLCADEFKGKTIFYQCADNKRLSVLNQAWSKNRN